MQEILYSNYTMANYLFSLLFFSLLSSSRDSTYREEDPATARCNFIDDLSTNGIHKLKTANFFSQTLSRNFKTQIPTHHTHQIRTQLQQQQSVQQQSVPLPVQQQQQQHQQQKQQQYSIKKSSSCSSFLYDILFRGISSTESIAKSSNSKTIYVLSVSVLFVSCLVFMLYYYNWLVCFGLNFCIYWLFLEESLFIWIPNW